MKNPAPLQQEQGNLHAKRNGHFPVPEICFRQIRGRSPDLRFFLEGSFPLNSSGFNALSSSLTVVAAVKDLHLASLLKSDALPHILNICLLS